MTVSYGFYNSLAGDRRYSASQMSALFDGIISDGILPAVGTKFQVIQGTGMQVKVGVGRAWFNGTWTYNDSELGVNIDVSEIGFHRIDVVILEIDTSEEVRANSIKVIKGTPSSTPSAPALTNTTTKHQYPLAHIYVGAGVTSILTANITSKIDTVDCPIAGGILETLNTIAWQSDYDTLVGLINALADQANSKNTAEVGKVDDFAGSTAPTGWLKANGAAVSRTTYASLFAYLVTNAGFTSQNFTVTIASPGVVTKSSHGFVGGERLRLSTTGALPTGLNTTTDYFVNYIDANTFRLSTSIGGSWINTSGSQSGTHSFMRSIWGLGDGSTTFNLPDLRGVTKRGWDDGKGLDSGRVLGSYQLDGNKLHGHSGSTASAGDHTHAGTIANQNNNFGTTNLCGGTLSGSTWTSSTAGAHTHGVTINNDGNAEATVKNTALLTCIKY